MDLAPRPSYPFEFHQADALTYPLDGFELIHASPPCQEYSAATQPFRSRGRTYQDLVAPVRERLRASGIPYVIENVVNAPLLDPITLCGTMFGLQVYRHRLFETSFPITAPPHPAHTARCAPMGKRPEAGDWITVVGSRGGGDPDASVGAMGGGWWMTGAELSQSIPPTYSLYVGRVFVAWARHELPPETVTTGAGASGGEVDQPRHDLQTEIVTRLPDPDADRRARERALAADRARRYRARRRGLDVPRVKPGPTPGRESVQRARRRYEAAELARLRTLLAGYRMIDDGGPTGAAPTAATYGENSL